MWDMYAFEKVLDFFNKNSIDVVSCRVKFFEKRNDYPGMDWKFKKIVDSKIVDINKDSDYIQMNGNSCFIKRSIVDNQFHDKLWYAQDLRFITELILKSKKYALLKDAIYLYRVRNSNDSAMQVNGMDKRYFIDTVDYCLIYLKKLFEDNYPTCITYMNNIILYDFHWRLNANVSGVLNKDELKKYYQKIKFLLNDINIEIINKKDFLNDTQKKLIIKMKK